MSATFSTHWRRKKIAIDLDDGVKVNYVKFGTALKKIPGLEAKEE